MTSTINENRKHVLSFDCRCNPTVVSSAEVKHQGDTSTGWLTEREAWMADNTPARHAVTGEVLDGHVARLALRLARPWPWSCSSTCTAPESEHCQDCRHCPGTHDAMCRLFVV